MTRSRRLLCVALSLCAVTSVATAGGGDAPHKSSASMLPAKSRWAGTEAADKSHARSQPQAVRMRVTSRDGATFTADFFIGPDAGVKLKGTVADDGTIDCVPVSVIRGKFERDITEDHWTGTATEKSVTLSRKITGNGGSRSMELTPAKGKDKDD